MYNHRNSVVKGSCRRKSSHWGYLPRNRNPVVKPLHEGPKLRGHGDLWCNLSLNGRGRSFLGKTKEGLPPTSATTLFQTVREHSGNVRREGGKRELFSEYYVLGFYTEKR